MKTTKSKRKEQFLLGVLFFAIAFGNSLQLNAQEALKIDQSSKRYRLADKKKNYFSLEENVIKLAIPVSDPGLRFQKAVDISSANIDAILIWLDGTRTYGECKVKKEIKKSINIDKLTGLKRNHLKESKKMVVAFFNNDTFTEADTKEFKKLIASAVSYEAAVEALNKDNDCNTRGAYQPRESGGDILGGN